MNADRFERKLARALREDAGPQVPAALDHRVRVTLRTAPLAGVRPFESPTMALGIAIAATLAMTVSLAISFAEAGAGENGVPMAAAIVVAYLAAAAVVAFPLLTKLRSTRRYSETDA